MKIMEIWLKIRGYWVGKFKDYWADVVRLDGVSRSLSLGALVVGVAYGLLPIAGLAVFMRLTSALMGARGIGVLTSLLRDALWQVVALWVLGLLLMFGVARLRGVMKKVALRTSTLVMVATMSVCLFLIGAFRFILWAVIVLVAEAWPLSKRWSVIVLAVIVLLGLSFFYSVVHVLVARSITVGGFFLFNGAVVYVTTWYLHRKVLTMI
ncbi:TPA: hypothetical protein DEP96_02295 [Candidatus Uhrbacteria bacterium]|nr:hypothetical protein [Candidatus Uhrbacteria bacterium]